MSILINDVNEGRAVMLILQEMCKNRYRKFPEDRLRGTALMCEEAGEALQAALDLTRDWSVTTTAPRDEIDKFVIAARKKLYYETIQTGAMAVKLLIAMFEEEDK